ncbi:MAG: universal stress protein [Algoriphagus sp.]|uniref:universal stress protein n=1 Tax=Algoriphagus sp. TaxID=1872435 RepID=UPI00261BCCC4|nr:universal stress protein [Algoriphagus sp.]MDG1276727.1 universal stress protein [Algoriphagus sp.]
MKILVPIDFSQDSLKALEFALGLGRGKKTEILLVHIIEVVYDFASQAAIALDTMHKDAESMMNKLIKDYSSDEVHLIKIIKEGTASISLARIAEEKNVDLIVMGTKGASGVKKILIGSTTVNLIKESNIPILVVPEKSRIEQILNLTLALEFSDHEIPLIQKSIGLSKEWDLPLNFLHIQKTPNFKDKLAAIGLKNYIETTYDKKNTKVNTINSDTLSEGIETFLSINEETILIMCHQHKNFWKQMIEGSQSINMAYHIHIPLLVMN